MRYCNDCNEPDFCHGRNLCINKVIEQRLEGQEELTESDEVIEPGYVTIINNEYGSFHNRGADNGLNADRDRDSAKE